MSNRMTPDAVRPPSRTKKLIFLALIMVVIPTIVALGLAEAYLRIFRPNVDLWAATGRKPGGLPVAAWADVDAFSAYRARSGIYRNRQRKTVNSHGFISTPELAIPKPPNTLRIAFLGGSSTAGTGPMSGATFGDEETWPWQVVDSLQEYFTGMNVELINAALPGYSSFESYGRLWSRIRFFEPDAVVVYHGWNELYYFHLGDQIITWRTFSDGSWALEHPDVTIATHRPLAVDHILRHSQVLSRLRLRFGAVSQGEIGGQREATETYNPAGLEVWRSNLRLLKTTSDMLGAQIFIVKQATLITDDLAPEHREKINYAFHGFGHEAHVDAYRQMYRIVDEEFSPPEVIDATPLSGIPEYFYDHVHPTSDGAAKLAELVSGALIRELRVDDGR